jgi:hypothetical protein
MIERASKIATAASTLLILILLLWFHPDITRALQIGGAAAFLLAWLAGRRWGDRVIGICLFIAPVAPALLRILAGREQTVLDVIWMAPLAGALLGQVSWSRWMLPQAWRPLAGGWALALALVWPVLAAREAGFDPHGLQDWGAVVSWASWPAPYAIAWSWYWVLMQLLGLLWLDWVTSYAARPRERLAHTAQGLWMGVTAASVVAVVQGTIDWTFLNSPFWAAEGRATGTMLEANGYGHCAAIAGPVALVILRSIRGGSPAWAWTALAVNWAGVWMSGSRTAFLCAAIGAAGLALGLWRSGERASRRQVLAGGGAIAIAALAIAISGGATGPLRRFAEIPFDAAGITALWERGGYGSIATQMVREYPLTGTGAGTYHYLAPDYYRAAADDALAPDNAQNWWRHQAAELGILGGAMLFIWSGVLAWRVVAGRRIRAPHRPADVPPLSPAGDRFETLAVPIVRGLLVGLGLSSLVGVPTQNPVVLLAFFMLAGWLAVLVPAAPAGAEARWIHPAWTVAALLAVSYAAGHVWLARTSLSVPARASRFERAYVAGAYQPEPQPDGPGEFRWTDDESRFVMPAESRWLVVRLWASHPDIQALPVEVRLSTPCGVLWNEPLRTVDPVTLGVVLPPALGSVDTTVDVSRTWQPSAFGSDDERRLGVGISMSFVGSSSQAEEQTYTARWPDCGVPRAE